jgi:hypothetical protein
MPRVFLDPEPEPEPDPDPELSPIASDRIDGAASIAIFLFGVNDWPSRKKVYRMANLGTLPIARLGSRLIASKRSLTAAYERLTGVRLDD